MEPQPREGLFPLIKLLETIPSTAEVAVLYGLREIEGDNYLVVYTEPGNYFSLDPAQRLKAPEGSHALLRKDLFPQPIDRGEAELVGDKVVNYQYTAPQKVSIILNRCRAMKMQILGVQDNSPGREPEGQG